MRGFSLIEVLVVLALLSVVAAGVAPAMFRATTAAPLDQAATSVADTLRSIRRRALLNARPASLVTDVRSTRFWIAEHTRAGRDTVREGDWSLPPGVTLAHIAERAEWRFGPSAPRKADSLVLRDNQGVRIVATDPWTGAVTVR